MRKNISNLLQKGNLTPKERYLLLIQADVIEATTNKKTLTEADKSALQGWQAKTSNEAREWNKYNEGWKLSGRAGLEAEMTYWQTKADNYRKSFLDMQLNLHPIYRDTKKLIDNLQKIKVVDIKEAIEITNKQREQKLKDGLDFDYTIYQLAFESLSDKDKKRFIELYPDIETDHQYLDQEEIIANLFKGKDELTKEETKEAKEKLAELVAENCYNKFAKEYQLFHYFACIPLAEVARYFLISKGLKVKGKPLAKNQEADDEDSKTPADIKKVIEDYVRDNQTTMEAILKEACLKWLDEDLIDRYTPLVFSNDLELFNKWLKTKTEARATLQKLIDKGELKVREQTPDETRRDKLYSKGLYDSELSNAKWILESLDYEQREKGELDEKKDFEKFSDRAITGESLYNLKSDFEFVKDFKKRVDEYNANLGIVYADGDTEQKGEHLDQELLIAEKDEAGKLNALSLFNLTTKRLSLIFEATNWIKETQKGKETYLSFNDDGLEKVYKEIRASLIKGYERLLAFQEVFKRLNKTYKCDLDYALKERVKNVGEFIDSHNEALSKAIGQTLHGGDDSEGSKEAESWLIKRRGVLKTKDDLFIKKDSILADNETLKEWTQKFEDILGDDF